MDWPSLSPDLNPMENVWSILSQRVYCNGRQFETKEKLIETIKTCWERIENEVIDSLVAGMKNRCIEILKNNGEILNY